MSKAQLVKRKTALKELVVKLLGLWWDAWAEQSDPHSCSYSRICLLVVVVLQTGSSVWYCPRAGPTAQQRAQTQKSRCVKPQRLHPFERLTLRWTSWLHCCGQVVATCSTLMLNSASAPWYVCKITTWKHRAPIPRNLHGGGVRMDVFHWEEDSRRPKEGIPSVQIWALQCLTVYRWWMNSFFLEAETRMVLSTQA